MYTFSTILLLNGVTYTMLYQYHTHISNFVFNWQKKVNNFSEKKNSSIR